jgi:hypothetical protein
MPEKVSEKGVRFIFAENKPDTFLKINLTPFFLAGLW